MHDAHRNDNATVFDMPYISNYRLMGARMINIATVKTMQKKALLYPKA